MTKRSFFKQYLLPFIFFVLASTKLSAQKVYPTYDLQEIKSSSVDSLKQLYGKNKQLPKGYELQALLALSHYPELKDVKIKFKMKKGGAPFVSRPTAWSTFFKRKSKRDYLIFIRTKSHSMFDPILMQNMPFDAQVGVLGHELGHTADYIHRGFGKMMKVVFGNLSYRFLDKFEFETDRRAVHHGLGFQILAWSEHAIQTLRVNEPAPGAKTGKFEGIMERERYMRPNTIRKEMSGLRIYDDFMAGNTVDKTPSSSNQ